MEILRPLEKQIKRAQMTTIWLSLDTYRKLLLVEREFMAKKGCNTNPDDAIRELIEFWKKHKALGARME